MMFRIQRLVKCKKALGLSFLGEYEVRVCSNRVELATALES